MRAPFYKRGNAEFSAGGIIPYDSDGLYVISEKGEYNDIGGRFRYEDINIYATIAREFREETYHSCDLRVKDISLIEKKEVELIGFRGVPVYLCIFVHLDELKKYDCELSSEDFSSRRSIALKENPSIKSKDIYLSEKLIYIPWSKINNHNLLGRRLKAVLEHSETLDLH